MRLSIRNGLELAVTHLLVWFWWIRVSGPERAHLQRTDACGLHHKWMYIKYISFPFAARRTYVLWTFQLSFADTSSSQTDASAIYIIYMHCFHLYRKRIAVFWCACFILPVWIFKCYVLSRTCMHYLANVEKAVFNVSTNWVNKLKKGRYEMYVRNCAGFTILCRNECAWHIYAFNLCSG